MSRDCTNPETLKASGIRDLKITPEGAIFFCEGCQCYHGPVERCDICGKLRPVDPGTNIMCKECHEKWHQEHDNKEGQ